MYTPILTNPQRAPITIDQLRKHVPAVYAKEPSADVSKRYGFIASYNVLEALDKAGFVPVEARNYMRRDSKLLVHTKHMLRFRQRGDINKLRQVGDTIPEVIMLNAHDRSSRFEFYAGLFRLLCANGLVVSAGGIVKPVIVRHTTNMVQGALEAAMQLIEHAKNTSKYIGAMQRYTMPQPAQLRFAAKALEYRPQRAGVIEPAALLVPRREADKGDDMWHVFNRVQENLTKGEIAGVTADGRRVRTAPIRSINADMAINAGMWELAMQTIAKAAKK